MDPFILGVIIAMAIPIVWLLTGRLGGHTSRRIQSEDEVRSLMLTRYPTIEVGDVQVDADGRSAMLGTPHGVALMRVVGHHIAIRHVGGNGLKTVVERGETLRVQVKDPGFPHFQITVGAQALRVSWLQRLTALGETGS